MKQFTLFLLAALLAPLSAQAPDGFAYWSSAEIKKIATGLGPKVTAKKIAGQDLANWGNHWTSITHREGDGQGELHATVADIFVAEGGEATLIVGGKLVEPQETSKGETLGRAIEGGVRRHLAPGDIVHIPANTPHQLLVPKSFDYFVIKVAMK